MGHHPQARGNSILTAPPTCRRLDTRLWDITVRSGTRWNDGQPEHVEYTAQEIEALVGEFERLEIELFKLRHRIKARRAA
jgi:hypothetical protein